MSPAQALPERMSGAASLAGLPGALRPSLYGAVLRSNVSGVVRDRAGRPQIGAMVELLSAEYGVVARTFTDDRGRYSLARLGAGMYQVEATNSLFLPTIHSDLRLLSHSKVIVNLTLSTLYQALQWLPAEPRTPAAESDDWAWTLRLSANRPLLRLLDPGQAAAQTAQGGIADHSNGPVLIEAENRTAQGSRQVMVHSGLRRFGQGGLEQQVVWNGDSETRTVLLAVQSAIDPSGLGRLSTSAAYHQELSPDRSVVTIVTLADRPSIQSGATGGLITTRLRSASTVRLGDLAEVSAGTEFEAARLGGTATVFGSHPFAAVQVHAGDTLVRYSMASAPTATGADALPEQAALDAPALSESGGVLRMEQGLHQELAISRRVRSWTGEISLFHDTLAHPVVEGGVSGNEAALDSGDVLYDPGTGTIAVSGKGYSGGGVLAMLRDQLSPDTWLSLRYAMGDAAALAGAAPPGSSVAQAVHAPGNFVAQRTPMASVAAGTRLPGSGTVVRGSYRWQPDGTLTQVAPFDAGGAYPDAYLGLSIRQPLHLQRVGAGKLEAILDVRNLLAQGYRPFLSQDGTTVYFAQAQRCIAGGLSFSF